MDSPLISVMIPTKNREVSLKKALDSLVIQSFRDFELVVVDGGSTDNTKELVFSYEKHFPIQWAEKEGGLIPQMNVAYQIAHGKYAVRTDDDVIFSKGWLQGIFETFESDENIGGVTGPTVIPKEHAESRDLFYFEKKFREGGLFWKVVGKLYYGYFLEGTPYRVSHWCKSGTFTLGTNFETALNEPRQEVNNLEACNWAVRRDLLVRVGGFDPIYTGIGEYHEPDAACKIQKLGYKLVFSPKAHLFHCPSVEGFFKERPDSFPRIINFITFYFRHIQPNTLDKFVRFFMYLSFQNAFFVFQAIGKKQMGLLGAVPGTVVGLFNVITGLRR